MKTRRHCNTKKQDRAERSGDLERESGEPSAAAALPLPLACHAGRRAHTVHNNRSLRSCGSFQDPPAVVRRQFQPQKRTRVGSTPPHRSAPPGNRSSTNTSIRACTPLGPRAASAAAPSSQQMHREYQPCQPSSPHAAMYLSLSLSVERPATTSEGGVKLVCCRQCSF